MTMRDPRMLRALWNGLVKSLSPETETDYFDDSALAGKWTEIDTATTLTVSEGAQGLLLDMTSNADDNYAGVVQPSPAATQYVVTARIRLQGRIPVATILGSLIVGEDLVANPATASFWNCQLMSGATGPRFASTLYSNYTTWSSTLFDHQWYDNTVYLRVYVDETAGAGPGEVQAMISNTGQPGSWCDVAAYDLAGSVVSTIDTIGLMVYDAQNNGVNTQVYCDLFEVVSTTDRFVAVGAHVTSI